MAERPLIFVTNDDGFSAKGIQSLFDAVKDIGDIVLIAPDSPQSGTGHAITIHHPLRLNKLTMYNIEHAYSCSGTPVDCVKLGVYEVMHRKPDILVSGINHGANTSTNVLYSGTMSAAVEGAMEGIPSVGFSLDSFDQDADFSLCQEVVKTVVNKVLEKGMPAGTCLNVNIPDVSKEEYKGLKVCKQAHAYWADRFDKRQDQFGKTYYWLTGDFINEDQKEHTDLYWIAKDYATVVPTKFDMTAHEELSKIESWNL